MSLETSARAETCGIGARAHRNHVACQRTSLEGWARGRRHAGYLMGTGPQLTALPAAARGALAHCFPVFLGMLIEATEVLVEAHVRPAKIGRMQSTHKRLSDRRWQRVAKGRPSHGARIFWRKSPELWERVVLVGALAHGACRGFACLCIGRQGAVDSGQGRVHHLWRQGTELQQAREKGELSARVNGSSLDSKRGSSTHSLRDGLPHARPPWPFAEYWSPGRSRPILGH